MRWQRPIQAVLNRWSDKVDPFGHELREFFPNVVPTVVLGTDYVDDERATFTVSTLRPATLGNFAFISLCAIAGSIELLGVRVTGTAAATGFNTEVGEIAVQYTGTGLTAPTAPTNVRTRTGPATNYAAFDPQLILGGVGTTELVGNETKSLPEYRGTIIAPGFCIVLRTGVANLGLGAYFVWRNVGPRLP